MSAELREAADAVQRDWAARVDPVARHWAGELSSGGPDAAVRALLPLLRRETVLAAEHGTAGVARIVRAVGREPAAVAPADVAPPIELVSTIYRAWRRAEESGDAAAVRFATVRRIIDQSLTDAWRDGLQAAIVSDPAIIGWRRVARPGCCGACLALANGRIMAPTDPLWEHPFGRCFQEPVIHGVNDRVWGRPMHQQRWDAMTADEQNEMFAGHGGAAKADLIRSGDVTLDDLIAWQPRDPNEPNHRQLPREATLRELELDDDERAALSHRTGIEFGADGVTSAQRR